MLGLRLPRIRHLRRKRHLREAAGGVVRAVPVQRRGLRDALLQGWGLSCASLLRDRRLPEQEDRRLRLLRQQRVPFGRLRRRRVL